MIKPNQKIIFTTILLFLSVVYVYAQENPPPPQERGVMNVPPPGFPIDNGLIVLLAVALIYGVYRILKHSKTPKQA